MSPFVPLRVRSHGSLLAGVVSPEALCERAAELGHAALGLTDIDNLYLAVRFMNAAKGAGLKSIVGAELTALSGGNRALLIPFDRRGWASLCALLTARHLDDAFDLVRAIGAGHAGLHVIAESPGLAMALLAAGVPAAVPASEEVAKRRAHAGGVWLGVRGIAAERPRLRERLAESWRLGVPAVATGDVWLLDTRDHETHRVAVTAARGELLERMPRSAYCSHDALLRSPAEWVKRVRSVCAGAGCAEQAEPLLENNAALAARCHLTLEMGVPIFPRAPLPEGVSGAQRLRELSLAGVARRYAAGMARAQARRRLDTELTLIERMGFTDYFLLVADIVGFARERGIPTVGRGSGASSIVSYALGVTSVDPVRYGLCFERFLHPQRRDCPDLDVDLCWRRRDEVIEHVYEAYGHDRVAMISTHATLGPRSAFREAAKALGVPLPRVNALAKRVPRDLEASALEEVLEHGMPGVSARGAPARSTGATSDDQRAAERATAAGAGPAGARAGLGPHDFGPEFADARIAEALRLAARLAGAPRHLSVHCGGLVIGDRALTHYLPLERATKGVVVSQFEMRAVEAIGLVKMDLLGNRAITTIGECCTLAGRDASGIALDPAAADPDAIPPDDAIAAAAIAAGDTLNCFQLESPAMRNLLRMLRAKTLADTVAAVALVRPGPAESGMKEAFCRRRRGLEPVSYPHERLRETLMETEGVMLYEEDVMRVAAALCGLPLAEGETLRRAIAHARGDEEFRFLERGFIAQAAHAGVGAEDAHKVWCELARFAAYAFCKAHAAGYGQLAWQSAALKCRHPAEWAVGILNHHAGMYPTWVHVEDLRRGGIGRAPVAFLPPCVHRSGWDTTLEPLAAGGGSGSAGAILAAGGRSGSAGAPVVPRPVRVGLHHVAGLAHATAERVIATRPFASLADLVDRARPTPPELDALIMAGALDAFPGAPTRASMRLEARVHESMAVGLPARVRHVANPRAAGLLGADGSPLAPAASAPRPGGDTLPDLPELPLADRVRGEFAATGLWFSAHFLDVLVQREALSGCVSAAEIEHHAGKRVSVCGIPCAARRVESKTGGIVLFTTLADRTGLVECVLFPDAYRRWGQHMRGEVVRAEGRVDETLGALTVVIERAEPLGGRPVAPPWQEQKPPSTYRVA